MMRREPPRFFAGQVKEPPSFLANIMDFAAIGFEPRNPRDDGKVLSIPGVDASFLPKEVSEKMQEFVVELFLHYRRRFEKGGIHRSFFSLVAQASFKNTPDDELELFFPGRTQMIRKKNPKTMFAARDNMPNDAVNSKINPETQPPRTPESTARLMFETVDGIAVLRALAHGKDANGKPFSDTTRKELEEILNEKIKQIMYLCGKDEEGCSRCKQKNHKPQDCYFHDVVPTESVKDKVYTRGFKYVPAPPHEQANRMEWKHSGTSVGGTVTRDWKPFWFVSRGQNLELKAAFATKEHDGPAVPLTPSTMKTTALMQTLQLEDFFATGDPAFAISDGAIAVLHLKDGKVVDRKPCIRFPNLHAGVDRNVAPLRSQPATEPRLVQPIEIDDDSDANCALFPKTTKQLFANLKVPAKKAGQSEDEWKEELQRRDLYYQQIENTLLKRRGKLQNMAAKCEELLRNQS